MLKSKEWLARTERHSGPLGLGVNDKDVRRDLLADFAIAMISGETKGSDTLLRMLHDFFKLQPEVALEILDDIKTGAIKTKIITIVSES